MFPTSRYFNILGNNFVKIGIILKIFCDNMKYFLSICCQVFQVLHLTLCPTSPPPARQNQLNSPKNKKRKTTHEKGLNSHQLLIVWKVPRRLTWESLGGRRLQKMCFVFANIEKVSKRIRRQQKEVFRKYWESLAFDKIWESHRKFKTVSWIKKITFSPKNRPSVRSNDKRFSEKSLKQSSYIFNANKPNQQDVKTKIIMF